MCFITIVSSIAILAPETLTQTDYALDYFGINTLPKSYLLLDHMTGTPCEKLLVSSLPFNVTLKQFWEIFEAYGRVVNAVLIGQGKGYITYSSIDEARWIAENLDNNIPEGLDTFVNIQFASSPEDVGQRTRRPGPYSNPGKDRSVSPPPETALAHCGDTWILPTIAHVPAKACPQRPASPAIVRPQAGQRPTDINQYKASGSASSSTAAHLPAILPRRNADKVNELRAEIADIDEATSRAGNPSLTSPNVEPMQVDAGAQQVPLSSGTQTSAPPNARPNPYQELRERLAAKVVTDAILSQAVPELAHEVPPGTEGYRSLQLKMALDTFGLSNESISPKPAMPAPPPPTANPVNL